MVCHCDLCGQIKGTASSLYPIYAERADVTNFAQTILTMHIGIYTSVHYYPRRMCERGNYSSLFVCQSVQTLASLLQVYIR